MRINGHSVLIPVGEKWNPLKSVGAAPEYIPPTWDRPHTSLRLIQAFKTLSAIPVANGPRFKSSWWPHHPMEWIDIKAKEHEYLNDLDQAREAARQWHGHDTGLRRKNSAVWKRLCPGRHAICTIVLW